MRQTFHPPGIYAKVDPSLIFLSMKKELDLVAFRADAQFIIVLFDVTFYFQPKCLVGLLLNFTIGGILRKEKSHPKMKALLR